MGEHINDRSQSKKLVSELIKLSADAISNPPPPNAPRLPRFGILGRLGRSGIFGSRGS